MQIWIDLGVLMSHSLFTCSSYRLCYI